MNETIVINSGKMQSPSKRNSTPNPQSKPKTENKIKIKRLKQKNDDEEPEKMGHTQVLLQPVIKNQITLTLTPTPAPQTKKNSISSSPKKKMAEEDPLDVSNSTDKSSSTRTTTPPPLPETTVGRSGRVRKAKVVFDPSDDQTSKRRSTATENELKMKKPPTKLLVETKKEPLKRPALQLTGPEMANPLMVTKRRKTIASFENGCIVCTRSDIKKGRFVNCTDCNSRGHFTCLRNAKFISNSDEESNWQCAVCQICSTCCESSVREKLYKCNSCLNSYHLSCQKDKVAIINKKRFKCELCVVHGDKRKQSAGPNHSKTPSLDGFAGFSQEETTTKSNNIDKKSKPLKIVKKSVNRCNSNSIEYNNCLQIRIDEDKNNVIKDEPLTPTSKLEEILNGPESILPSSLDSANSVQSDLSVGYFNSLDEEMFAEQQKVNEAAVKKEVKNEPLVYDIKTRIIPHESIPDVRTWDCDEVYTYFLGTTTREYAHLFKDNGIDGYALLLLKRDDVLKQFKLTLGAALRLYSHIVSLQYKNNNPILAWEDF